MGGNRTAATTKQSEACGGGESEAKRRAEGEKEQRKREEEDERQPTKLNDEALGAKRRGTMNDLGPRDMGV